MHNELAFRLDGIELGRRRVLFEALRIRHPGLASNEVECLARELSSARIRLIAETALARLSEGERERILRAYELV